MTDTEYAQALLTIAEFITMVGNILAWAYIIWMHLTGREPCTGRGRYLLWVALCIMALSLGISVGAIVLR